MAIERQKSKKMNRITFKHSSSSLLSMGLKLPDHFDIFMLDVSVFILISVVLLNRMKCGTNPQLRNVTKFHYPLLISPNLPNNVTSWRIVSKNGLSVGKRKYQKTVFFTFFTLLWKKLNNLISVECYILSCP